MNKRNSNRRKSKNSGKARNNNGESANSNNHSSYNQKENRAKKSLKELIIAFIRRNGLLVLLITILLKIGVWIVMQKNAYDVRIAVLENDNKHLVEQVSDLADAVESLKNALGASTIYYVKDYDPNMNQPGWMANSISVQSSEDGSVSENDLS